MTAASGADQPTLRDQLLAWLIDRYGTKPLGALERRGFEVDASDLTRLVEADRERAKAEGGAEALERLAVVAKPDSGLLGEITRRAASLRATTGRTE